MPTEVQRELNEIEYFNWCVAQPYNMVVAVQIRGNLQPDRLERALCKAQARHPLLRANTELDARGIPWFSSRGVGPIPLSLLEHAEPADALKLAERELMARFAMDEPDATPRLPLLRVTLLLPNDPTRPSEVLLTVQHVIADGLSMVYLVRDLLEFMEQPEAPVAELSAPASSEDLLPPAVRRRIPSSPVRFRIALWLAKLYAWLRFRNAPAAKRPTQSHRFWQLTPAQTSRLRERCRREGVSVQSVICAAFLHGFSAVHTPVSLRGRLARPVGESVGLYIGAAEVQLKYRAARTLWQNARAFQRKLRRALRNPFGVYGLFCKAVPKAMVQELGPLLARIMSNQRPFAVTNLGELDAGGLRLAGRELKIESFFGAVSPIVDSSVLTVYTLGKSLRLHLLASEAGPSEHAVRDDAERAVQRLLAALED